LRIITSQGIIIQKKNGELKREAQLRAASNAVDLILRETTSSKRGARKKQLQEIGILK